MASCLALVFNLLSEVWNTNSIKDVDHNITIVTSIGGVGSIVVDLDLIRKVVVGILVLHRSSVRRFWSVCLDMLIVAVWVVYLAR